MKTPWSDTSSSEALSNPPTRICWRSTVDRHRRVYEFFSSAIPPLLDVPSVGKWSIKYIFYDVHIFISFYPHARTAHSDIYRSLYKYSSGLLLVHEIRHLPMMMLFRHAVQVFLFLASKAFTIFVLRSSVVFFLFQLLKKSLSNIVYES